MYKRQEYIIRKAAELGMSQRTLYRHMDKYLEAAGWALKMLRETGANYLSLPMNRLPFWKM